MLRFVELGGESRPLNFGMNALAEASKLVGVEWVLDITTSGMDFNVMRALFWAGLKDGARIQQQPFSYSPEEVAGWFDSDMRKMVELRSYFDEDVLLPMSGVEAKKDAAPAKKKSPGTMTSFSKSD